MFLLLLFELLALWLISLPCVFLHRFSAELIFIILKYLVEERQYGKRERKCVSHVVDLCLWVKIRSVLAVILLLVIFSFPKWEPKRKNRNFSKACLKGITRKIAHKIACNNDVFWTRYGTNSIAIVTALSSGVSSSWPEPPDEVQLQEFLCNFWAPTTCRTGAPQTPC